MAKKKKGGLINRILMGSEKSEGYARASLPSNRWELFWDIFKGRFWKLVLINLLMVLFFLPFFALLLFRSMSITGQGAIYPFSQGFGVGYQAPSSFVGFSETIMLNTNLVFYLFLPLVFAIAAVGLSGGAYIMRNMVWTEGIFIANDFWTGVKKNIKPMLFICLVYAIVFYASELGISIAEQAIAIGTAPKWLMIVCEVMIYAFLFFYSVMSLHMITMAVTYELKFRHMLKNAFLFSIAFVPQNIFFILAGAVPLILLIFGGFLMAIGIVLTLLFGFSIFLLVWTDYSQWIYDNFINDKIGAKRNRGIYEKVKESDASIKKYSAQISTVGTSALSSRPIKPITDEELQLEELHEGFSREDIEKLNRSRQMLYEDNERYIEEHKNDAEFIEAQEKREAMDAADKEREARIEKAKKELSKRKNR